ncbi:MAG TPA: RluA family pseudouridine synthase [Acidiphilium sp.]|nr:MAG: RNA pseudouridine synthase [Acidiphilium sp. 21-60-14]OYV90674.1 MAG: RNA pseudouridine synthase [Acidiphilium sp. 37-60-79]OZB38452.1 MAG: RNA pseudouridine synthase [Acidiphilium sp. 34-60-192]HQT87570.1 RluA family pseudouridine synthase [Acidiphilium sp.]HQU24251.1 RluA family pseudouridine synthase [Acidiphilium sp.]
MRLDRFIAARLGSVSRARIKNLIEAGAVSVAGKPMTAPATAVRAGTVYDIVMPAPEPATPVGQAMALDILYEDADLLVLDKQAGLVVHPAPGNQDGTLVNALIAHCGDSLTGIGAERRPGIVHRLDKDTSGLMVVAKTEMTHVALSAAFAARDIDRAYTALCWGVPAARDGEIEGDIGRDPRDRKRMAVVTRGGKTALTRYRVEESFEAAAARLTCRLATGRTHQIRVHLAARGHPLIGDPVYLRRIPAMAARFDPVRRRAMLDFPRQALHAHRLGFRHPRSGAMLSFETPLPADLADLLILLRRSEL